MVYGQELSPKISLKYYETFHLNDVFLKYPELKPFNDQDPNIRFLMQFLMADKNIKYYNFDTWCRYESKNIWPDIDIHQKNISQYEKRLNNQIFFEKNRVNYITTAVQLWKFDSAMNILAAYELRRFRKGFDYNFTSIKQLMTYQWAEKKGYIKNESDTEKFKTLFTKSIHRMCNEYTLGSFIVEPRGIEIPIYLPETRKNIQYRYNNGILIIQDHKGIQYTFQHNNDSLKLISEQNTAQNIPITRWDRSGNIGTSEYALMSGCEKKKFMGLKYGLQVSDVIAILF